LEAKRHAALWDLRRPAGVDLSFMRTMSPCGIPSQLSANIRYRLTPHKHVISNLDLNQIEEAQIK
jgi:hypothetical protein